MCSRRTRKRRGFSLVEIMVVIVIIGLLAGVVTLSVRSQMLKAYKRRVLADLANIKSAVELYEGETGRLPTNEQGLQVLRVKNEDYPDGMLAKDPVDPWRRPYQYNSPGRNGAAFEIICYGADGQEGGEGQAADVSSADLEEAK
jgi:general secretion pathway protein G